jgi:hypothetical protein
LRVGGLGDRAAVTGREDVAIDGRASRMACSSGGLVGLSTVSAPIVPDVVRPT